MRLVRYNTFLLEKKIAFTEYQIRRMNFFHMCEALHSIGSADKTFKMSFYKKIIGQKYVNKMMH